MDFTARWSSSPAVAAASARPRRARFLDEGAQRRAQRHAPGRSSRPRRTSSTRPASASQIVAGQITAREQAQALVAAAVERFGGVDVLVNCTGIFRIVPFLEQTEEHLEEALGSILRPTYWVSQAAAAAMRERGGGAIVNVGSMWAIDAIATTPTSAYSAAQAGRHALTKNLALELAPDEHPRQHGRAGVRRDARLRALPATARGPGGARRRRRLPPARPPRPAGRRRRGDRVPGRRRRGLDHRHDAAGRRRRARRPQPRAAGRRPPRRERGPWVLCRTHGPDLLRDGDRLPRRAAQLARRQPARARARRGRRGRQLRLAPRLAAHAVRRGLGRARLARRVRRPRRVADRVGDLLRGARPRARAAAGQRARPAARRPDADGVGHRRAEGALPRRRSSRPRRSGARASPSPTPAPTSRRSRRARSRTATTGSSPARRCGPAARSTRSGACSSRAPTARPPSTRASPTS